MWHSLLLLVACNGSEGPDIDDHWSGTLPAGAEGEATLDLPVERDAWHRITADANGDLAVIVYEAEPYDPDNLVAQCIAPDCVVDFVTLDGDAPYFLWVANYTTEPLDYTLDSETLPIPTLEVDGGPVHGEVVGLESLFVRFEAEAGTHWTVLDPAVQTDTPVAVRLFDEAGVTREGAFLSFTWAADTEPVDMENDLGEGPHYLKVQNLPDPFAVDPATAVSFDMAVVTSAP